MHVVFLNGNEIAQAATIAAIQPLILQALSTHTLVPDDTLKGVWNEGEHEAKWEDGEVTPMFVQRFLDEIGQKTDEMAEPPAPEIEHHKRGFMGRRR